MVKPWEKKKEDFVKKENGMREGIKKEDIINPIEVEKSKVRTSLTDEELNLIKIRRDIESKMFQDEDAIKCAARCDHYYQGFVSTFNTVDSLLFKLINSKSEFDRNAVDIVAGMTNKLYPGTNIKVELRDLKNQNILLKRDVTESIKGLWTMLAELYRYVNQHRIDRVVFFNDVDYKNKMMEVKKILGENGLDLFMEVK